MVATNSPRVLVAKTGLDGHWRGVTIVARALRDAGFEVIVIGMARADEIVAMAVQEDVDLVGLNIGGRIEVVERILEGLADVIPETPVFAGGTIAPAAVTRLSELGVRSFPPGSSLSSIVAAANELTGRACLGI
jgi:methylmalonyl-CoA mutase C-terminal domain/subunit